MKSLLLNSSYQVISFIPFKKVIKLLSKGKIEIIDEWDKEIKWTSGKIKYPATVRLNYYVKNKSRSVNFNNRAVYKRDQFICAYCGYQLTHGEATWDHIIPRSKGGESSWLNCITCCGVCNHKKANKTLKDSGMRLLFQPTIPNYSTTFIEYKYMDNKHSSWSNYFNVYQR
jgi:hypothetical protein